MGVNKHMGPVDTKYFQTYVDQYVPMPFELMQRKANQQQKAFDTAESNWGLLKQSMDNKMLEVDQTMNNTEVTGLQDRFNDELTKANGDYSQMTNVIRNIGDEYRTWASTEEGALGLSNKAGYDTNMASIADSDMSGARKDETTQAALMEYERTGGALNKSQYKGRAASLSTKDLHKEILDYVKELEPDQEASANMGYMDGDNLLYTSKSSRKHLDKADVRHTIKNRVYGDEAWQDQTQKDWENKSILGRPGGDVSLKEYRTGVFERDFLGLGDAFAYSQATKDNSIKSNATAAARASREPTSTASSFSYRSQSADKTNDDVIDAGNSSWGDSPHTVYQNKINGVASNFKGIVSEAFTDENIAGKFDDVYASLGYADDENGERQFLNDIRHGKVDAGKFTNSIAGKQHLIAEAKKASRDMRGKERLNIDILEDMVGTSITKDEFEQYRAGKEKLWGDDARLSRIVNDPKSSDEEIEAAEEELKAIDFQIMGLPDDFEAIHDEDGNWRAYGQDTSYTLAYDPNLNMKVGDLLDSDEANEALTKRMKYSKRANTNDTFGLIPIYDSEGNYDKGGSQKATDAMVAGIRKHPGTVLDKTVNRQGTEMSLSEALRIDASELEGDDKEKLYQNLVDEKIGDGNIGFGNKYNDRSGNRMISVAGYELDLGTGSGQGDWEAATKLDPQARATMAVNTYVDSALKSPGSMEEIEDGIFIHTKKPNSRSVVDDTYSVKRADNSSYSIRIDPRYFGIDGNTDYIYIPSVKGKEFLAQVKKIEDSVNKFGTFKINDVPYTKTEALTMLVESTRNE